MSVSAQVVEVPGSVAPAAATAAKRALVLAPDRVSPANGADDATALAVLAYRSCARVAATRAADNRGRYLAEAIDSYAASRVLSARQQQILGLYLEGKGDKEIASLCGCSEATVYEHWRRMARKGGGHNKGDSISDFHRFLGTRAQTIDEG